jgi:hypothetical protein
LVTDALKYQAARSIEVDDDGIADDDDSDSSDDDCFRVMKQRAQQNFVSSVQASQNDE